MKKFSKLFLTGCSRTSDSIRTAPASSLTTRWDQFHAGKPQLVMLSSHYRPASHVGCSHL